MLFLFLFLTKHAMVKKLIFIAFIILGIETKAQENNEDNILPFDQLEFSYNSGMIMPHAPAIDLITDEYISSFNVNILKHMDGNKLWEKLYRYPELGIGFYQGSLGNNRIYGKAYSLYAFFEAPAWNYRNKLEFNYRMSAGVSYVSQTFNLRDNIYNIAIGSHLNIHFNLYLNALISITESNKIISGVSLTHFSNGKIQSPNKGLNVINGSVGIRHYFRQPSLPKKEFTLPGISDKDRFSLIWSQGLKDHNRFKKATYYISSMNLNYERKYAHVAKAGVGIDAFYNSSLVNVQERNQQTGLSNPNLYRLGIHLSHDIIAGDFSLTMQLGHYFYNRAFYITDIYNRVGLRYYTRDGMILNLSLKSHNANAEFIEFGIGYVL